MKTFKELVMDEMEEVRQNDPITNHLDAHSRIQFAAQSINDIMRHFAACKMTEHEMHMQMQQALVYIANLAQHSAESLGMCPPEEVRKEISEALEEDCVRAVEWLADYIQENKERVRSTQLGGQPRFSVEFDTQTLHALFELVKAQKDD